MVHEGSHKNPHRADENGVDRPGRLGFCADRSRVGPGRGRLEPRAEHADLGGGGIEVDGRAIEPGLRGGLRSGAEWSTEKDVVKFKSCGR